MKISYQWILAAIIVILVILVGAYALTNGNNSPATNVTATPTTTITPTATVLASPTATPSTSATATPAASTKPTATPTLSGSNGVKLTDFGYYITYPPFSENQVNVNKGYVADQGDVVYFSPTSSTINQYIDLDDAEDAPDAVAVVHRSGNLSGTTHVTIDVSDNDYIDDWSFVNTVDESDYDHADVTFAPGESEKVIGIYVWAYGSNSDVGQLTLKIAHVDGVDAIGSNDQYTLNVNIQTSDPSPSATPTKTVQFATSQGYLASHEGCTIDHVDEGNGYNIYYIDFDIKRTGDYSNVYTPVVDMTTNIPAEYKDTFYILDVDPFQVGHDTTTVHVEYSTSYLKNAELSDPYGDFSLSSSGGYGLGSPSTYHLDLGFEG
jgi:hypothetical protein